MGEHRGEGQHAAGKAGDHDREAIESEQIHVDCQSRVAIDSPDVSGEPALAQGD
jgi:hypothetical protein